MDVTKIIKQLKEKQKSQPSKNPQQIDPEKLATIRERFAKIRAKFKEKTDAAK